MRSVLAITSSVLLLTGCGGGKAEPEPSIAKALSHVVEGQDKAKAVSDKEALGKLREKAAEEAAKVRQEEMEKLLVIPSDMPTDLTQACSQLAEAFDAFRQARITDEGERGRWNALKGRDLENMTTQCKQAGDLKVAACKLSALRNAPASFLDGDSTKIIAACEDRYGSGRSAENGEAVAGR